MDSIGFLSLKNNGGFVCAGALMYINDNGDEPTTERWHYINLGESEIMIPNDRGLAAGTVIQMKIIIVAGDNRTGGKWFIYDPVSTQMANYSITGTTLHSTVHFDGISTVAP